MTANTYTTSFSPAGIQAQVNTYQLYGGFVAVSELPSTGSYAPSGTITAGSFGGLDSITCNADYLKEPAVAALTPARQYWIQ